MNPPVKKKKKKKKPITSANKHARKRQSENRSKKKCSEIEQKQKRVVPFSEVARVLMSGGMSFSVGLNLVYLFSLPRSYASSSAHAYGRTRTRTTSCRRPPLWVKNQSLVDDIVVTQHWQSRWICFAFLLHLRFNHTWPTRGALFRWARAQKTILSIRFLKLIIRPHPQDPLSLLNEPSGRLQILVHTQNKRTWTW
jgi:hypothetical protein